MAVRNLSEVSEQGSAMLKLPMSKLRLGGLFRVNWERVPIMAMFYAMFYICAVQYRGHMWL